MSLSRKASERRNKFLILRREVILRGFTEVITIFSTSVSTSCSPTVTGYILLKDNDGVALETFSSGFSDPYLAARRRCFIKYI